MSNTSSGATNTWEDGIYQCSLFSFIHGIHNCLQQVKSERDVTVNSEYTTYSRSRNYQRPMTDYSNGNFWVKPAFNKLTPSTVDISYYKDLVELASNLDHIDEE